jgi:hypothetical protein
MFLKSLEYSVVSSLSNPTPSCRKNVDEAVGLDFIGSGFIETRPSLRGSYFRIEKGLP